MSTINSEGIAVHLESTSHSPVQKHESSNLLRSAFQKAIERAADKQAAADRVTLSSALADQNNEVPQDNVPDTTGVAELSTWSINLSVSHTDKFAQRTDVRSLPQTPLPDPAGLETSLDDLIELVQTNDISPAPQRLNTSDYRSIDTLDVMPTDSENHQVITSEHIGSSPPNASSALVSPIARGGIDQQAFDTLSHMLSRQNSLGESETEALTLKVIAGMSGVESLMVQQDQCIEL